MLTLWLLLLWLGDVYPEVQGQKPFVCPSEWGVFPHPDNHTRFFRCVGGRPIMNTCVSGVFVQARRSCSEIGQSGQRTQEMVSNYSTTTSFSDVRSSTSFFSSAFTASPANQTEPAPSGSDVSSIMSSGINFTTKSENSSGISGSSSTAVTPSLKPRKFPERKSENTDNDEEKSGISPTTSFAIDEEHPRSWGDDGGPTTIKSIFGTDSISSRVEKTRTTAKSPHKIVPESAKYYNVNDSSQDSEKYGKKTKSKDDESLLNDSKKYDKRTASKDGEDLLIDLEKYGKRTASKDDEGLLIDPKKYGKRTASKDDENLLIYSKTYDNEATSDESFLCPEESGFFPHHTNCTRFFWCVHWRPSAMVCGTPGERFDPKKHICSRIHGAEDCPGRQGTAEHSHHQIGTRYDIASYVNHVVQDARKKRSVLSGSRGHTRNVSRDDVNTSTSRIRRSGRHVRQAEVPNTPKEELRASQETGNRRSSDDAPATSLDFEAGTLPVFRCPRDGFHADPQDCSVFYHCSHGRAFRHKCQPGTSFHKDKLVCGWPLSKEGCGDKLNAPDTPTLPHTSGNENVISDEFQCPDEMTGFYPHSEDCTVFFQCAEGKAYRQQCGPGTAFNQEQGVCSWPMKLDTGCGAILENTVGDHLPDHKAEDSGYKAGNVGDSSGAEQVRDYNSKPVSTKTETFSKNLLKQVYPETTFETVSPIPRKLVSETSSNQLTRTTRSSFLIKDPLTNPRKVNDERLPTSDDDTIKHQNLTSNIDPNNKELLKTGKAKFRASKFIPSDHEVKGGKLNNDLGITPDTTKVSTTTEDTFSMNQATTQSSLSDEDLEQKLEKLRAVKLSVAWPWERVKQKQSQEKKTAPENAFTSTELNKQETTTKPTLSSMSSISHWYLSSTKKMSLSSTTPVVKEDTRNSEPSTVPTTKMSATESAMMASTEPRREFRKVRAETYKVVAADTDFRCPIPTGHFRDPLNCAVYYRCIEGLAYRNDCPSGKLYDTQRHKCLLSSQVTNCWRTDAAMMNGKRRMNDFSFQSGDPGTPYTPNDVTNFRCPKSHGLYRDPQDCRIFYRCSVGRPFRHECESGTVFSTERGLCAPLAIVPDCLEVTQQQQEVNSPSSSTSHESAHTTRKHQHASSPDKNCHHQDDELSTSHHTSRDVKRMGYDVKKGVREDGEGEKLQGGAEFEAEVDEDDWDPLNALYVTPGNMPDEATDFRCPRHVFNHFYPDPVSCWRFHRCFRGRRFSFLCPPGTFYDAVRKLCDFQHKVPDCDPQGRRLPGSWTSSESVENEVDAWPVTDTDDSWEYMPESSPKPYARPVSDDDDNREYMSQPSPNYIPSSKLCPQSEGLFAHPSSCRKFVYCSRGAPVVLTCPPDLLYNTDTMTCDYDDNIVCLRYDK